jgi:hypothetical protein
MVPGFGSGLRRLAALAILVAGGAPAALELWHHSQGSIRAIHHVEAASTTHHADNCLVASLAGEKITPLICLPALGRLTDPIAVGSDQAFPSPISFSHRLPTSRSPPRS